MPPADEYVARAAHRVIDLLAEHHAMVHPEVMARISEGFYASSSQNIDPHHVTTALRELHREGTIHSEAGLTRGGHKIMTLHLTQPAPKTRTVAARAAARKRLLLARYTGWSQGTAKNPHGIIGPAGETAVRSALHSAGAMQPATPGFGPVPRILNTKLPGPADSGGYLVPLSRAGIPGPTVTVLVEVKNIRSWIYPSSEELVQLLNKCLVLKDAHPDQPIIGILACRRAHPTTFWMAKQLGFMVIEMALQFAGSVGRQELDEVRNELYLTDLRVGTGPSLRVRDRVANTLPAHALTIAERWGSTAADPGRATAIGRAYTHRRQEKARLQAIDALRIANESSGNRGGW
jgi:hypothetical protein